MPGWFLTGSKVSTNLFYNSVYILNLMYYGNANFCTAKVNFGRFNAFHTANRLVFYRTKLFFVCNKVSSTNSSFHNTTGNTKDCSGTCVGTNKAVCSFFRKVSKVNSGFADKHCKFAGCKNHIIVFYSA